MSFRVVAGVGLAVVGIISAVTQPLGNRSEPQSLMIAGGTKDKVKRGAVDPREAVGWIEASEKLGSLTKTSGCSGTLIAPDLVLTALHCFVDSMPGSHEPSKITFSVGWKKSKPIDSVEITHIDYLRKPRFRDSWESASTFARYFASDMVIAHLSRPVKDEVAPLPFDCVRDSDEKAVMQAAGYGLRPIWGAPAYRFRAAVKPESGILIAFSMSGSTGDYPNMFANGLDMIPAPDSKESGMTCSGDSGGPLLAKRGSQLTVLGSLSAGDEGCKKKGTSKYSAITQEVAQFIAKSSTNGWPKQVVATKGECKFGTYLGL